MGAAKIPSVILPQPDNPLEFYETPAAFTKWLFETVPIGGHVYSPCAGSGAIHAVAWERPEIRHWTQSDIDPRWGWGEGDATDGVHWVRNRELYGPIDWTVDNPPFKPALDILINALTFSGQGVAFHLRVSFHEPLKRSPRLAFLREHPPTRVLYLPRFAFQRSRKTGQWRHDTTCTCWCVWERATTLLPAETRIYYPPEWVLDQLKWETPEYRARMDELMARF